MTCFRCGGSGWLVRYPNRHRCPDCCLVCHKPTPDKCCSRDCWDEYTGGEFR